jgi:hypothetical protein
LKVDIDEGREVAAQWKIAHAVPSFFLLKKASVRLSDPAAYEDHVSLSVPAIVDSSLFDPASLSPHRREKLEDKLLKIWKDTLSFSYRKYHTPNEEKLQGFFLI